MRKALWLIGMSAVILLTGCFGREEPVASQVNEVKPILVKLFDTGGKEMGTAELSQRDEGVQVKVEARGLTPGFHGFHIHEKAACVAPSFESAGGHFAPQKAQHGFLDAKGPHAGDLPNLLADASGTANAQWITDRVTLVKGKGNSLLSDKGTALVIHSGADDYITDPSGDSGSRVACGVITAM